MLSLIAQQASPSQLFVIFGAFAVIIFLLIVFAVFARYFRLWIQSVSTGARI